MTMRSCVWYNLLNEKAFSVFVTYSYVLFKVCMLKELQSSTDGHHEYIMNCETKQVRVPPYNLFSIHTFIFSLSLDYSSMC